MSLHLGHLAKATHNKYICQKKEKQQYIAVETVTTFIEFREWPGLLMCAIVSLIFSIFIFMMFHS